MTQQTCNRCRHDMAAHQREHGYPESFKCAACVVCCPSTPQDDLQRVKDAIEQAQRMPNPEALLIPGTLMENSFRAMVRQSSATNAAVLAWLDYQAQREQERQEAQG